MLNPLRIQHSRMLIIFPEARCQKHLLNLKILLSARDPMGESHPSAGSREEHAQGEGKDNE